MILRDGDILACNQSLNFRPQNERFSAVAQILVLLVIVSGWAATLWWPLLVANLLGPLGQLLLPHRLRKLRLTPHNRLWLIMDTPELAQPLLDIAASEPRPL